MHIDAEYTKVPPYFIPGGHWVGYEMSGGVVTIPVDGYLGNELPATLGVEFELELKIHFQYDSETGTTTIDRFSCDDCPAMAAMLWRKYAGKKRALAAYITKQIEAKANG